MHKIAEPLVCAVSCDGQQPTGDVHVNSSKPKKSLCSQEFLDIIAEMHSLVLTGIPGTTDFLNSEVFREYVALALAIYYQCEHCRTYHGNALKKLQRPEQVSKPVWKWRNDIYKVVLFLRTDSRMISEPEWQVWRETWQAFAGGVALMHPGLPCAIAYVIGMARDDRVLMDLAFAAMKKEHENVAELRQVIQELFELMLFMKLATTKNRAEPFIVKQLESAGITL